MSQLMIDDLRFCEEVTPEDGNVKGGLLGFFDSLEAQVIGLGYDYERTSTDTTDTIAITNTSLLPGGGMAAQSASASVATII
ncbi:hypothetical protein [Lyngbya aestuarii]|uniref:hypothetical protein n=1 Tax=Lyngbya aestuarii TaxID=118322 RepID=UPI00403E30C5